ncbi:hypothetical protein FHW36_11046 [Chitinophaga polysaccharea]|uniref:Uncharacterized protein n=1 Tax=Chitinophaga polysaccharea TaxID=1293035 RepID=A0A561P9U8_9BACT|nr:hypothetical protein FHW36_11046 [Chitinophaga polysaccharea]
MNIFFKVFEGSPGVYSLLRGIFFKKAQKKLKWTNGSESD